MSESVKRIGSVTILMWMVGLFTVPTIGYIASNALQIPSVVTQLKHMVNSQEEMVIELKALSAMHRSEEIENRREHKLLSEMIVQHSYGLKNIEGECGDNIKDIKECHEKIDFIRIKNGY